MLFILEMVEAFALASVHSASRITPTEWDLIQSLVNALTALLAKRPTGGQ